MCVQYRRRAGRVAALSPQGDALQWPQVGRHPGEPLVVAPTPLAVVDQHALLVVVDLLDSGRIPEGTEAQNEKDGLVTRIVFPILCVCKCVCLTRSCGGLWLQVELQPQRLSQTFLEESSSGGERQRRQHRTPNQHVQEIARNWRSVWDALTVSIFLIIFLSISCRYVPH